MTIEKAREIIGCVRRGWLRIKHNGGEYEFLMCQEKDIYSRYFPIDTNEQKETAAKWLSILGGKEFNGCRCKYHKQSHNAVYGGCKKPGNIGACIDTISCEHFEPRVHRDKQEG
jgi:hypothetical protein